MGTLHPTQIRDNCLGAEGRYLVTTRRAWPQSPDKMTRRADHPIEAAAVRANNPTQRSVGISNIVTSVSVFTQCNGLRLPHHLATDPNDHAGAPRYQWMGTPLKRNMDSPTPHVDNILIPKSNQMPSSHVV